MFNRPTKQIRFKKLHPQASTPARKTAGAAAYDLTSTHDLILAPHGRGTIGTGIAVEIPHGIAGHLYIRSGIAYQLGLTLTNCVGIIDSDYRGEIKAILTNLTGEKVTLKKGERVVQLEFVPILTPVIMEARTLTPTMRGHDGFGSTGK